jgi:hypothetical protein
MRPTNDSGILTVAAVRPGKGKRPAEVLFNEREQIFTLPTATKLRGELSRHLTQALRKKAPVKALLDPRRGVVRKLAPPSPRELAEFERGRTLLEKPDKPVRVAVDAIDPTKFNLVGEYLKFKAFRLCDRIIPNYKTAKQIFDFCAQQSCHLPGPPSVPPCIPFQYVRDGCYARAHQMRRIIEDDYGYCCEKVFSFANNDVDRLAVSAAKWGGCCVTWWYHVAPLVRVRIRFHRRISLVVALVIDPGMFDKPVLLSSWLGAQKNGACSPNANVTMYSIQPGSAYWPANYQGTAYDTDPSYTQTNSTLLAYATLTTCP